MVQAHTPEPNWIENVNWFGLERFFELNEPQTPLLSPLIHMFVIQYLASFLWIFVRSHFQFNKMEISHECSYSYQSDVGYYISRGRRFNRKEIEGRGHGWWLPLPNSETYFRAEIKIGIMIGDNHTSLARGL